MVAVLLVQYLISYRIPSAVRSSTPVRPGTTRQLPSCATTALLLLSQPRVKAQSP